MGNKILIFVSIPAIEKEINLYIPINKKVGTVKNLIIKAIEEEYSGLFKNDGCKKLYDKQTGDLIDDHEFVKYSKLKNGTRLILF